MILIANDQEEISLIGFLKLIPNVTENLDLRPSQSRGFGSVLNPNFQSRWV